MDWTEGRERDFSLRERQKPRSGGHLSGFPHENRKERDLVESKAKEACGALVRLTQAL